jgi:uncharacterized membrane protein
MDWYVLTLMAICTYTLQDVLLKSAATRNCDKNLTTFFHLLTVTLISLPILLFGGLAQITTLGIAAAVVNGVFYSVDRITKLEALKYIPASVVYPILRLGDAPLVILLIVFLGEAMTFQNSVGIALAIVALYLLSSGCYSGSGGRSGGGNGRREG